MAAWRAPRPAPCSRRSRRPLAHAARARASPRRAPRAAARRRVGVNGRQSRCSRTRTGPRADVAVRAILVQKVQKERPTTQGTITRQRANEQRAARDALHVPRNNSQRGSATNTQEPTFYAPSALAGKRPKIEFEWNEPTARMRTISTSATIDLLGTRALARPCGRRGRTSAFAA
jgi:hypothetical protein